MAYKQEFLRLSYGGDVRTDDEWVNNLSIISDFESDIASVFNAANMNSIKTIIDTAYGTTNGMAPFNNLRWYKLAFIGQSGLYLADAKYLENTTPIVGTGTTGGVSPQDSVVISLRTATSRGLANRGRFYPPAGFTAPQNTTGLISDSSALAVATRFQTMINSLNTYFESIGQGGRVGVTSKEREGNQQPVTRVEVGNIMDNQNRRRNKLSETYVSKDIS